MAVLQFCLSFVFFNVHVCSLCRWSWAGGKFLFMWVWGSVHSLGLKPRRKRNYLTVFPMKGLLQGHWGHSNYYLRVVHNGLFELWILVSLAETTLYLSIQWFQSPSSHFSSPSFVYRNYEWVIMSHSCLCLQSTFFSCLALGLICDLVFDLCQFSTVVLLVLLLDLNTVYTNTWNNGWNCLHYTHTIEFWHF